MIKNALARVVRGAIRALPANMRVLIPRGPLRGLRWIRGASVNACWLGSYEPRLTQQFVEVIRPGQVVYDIGANVGYYTLLSAVLTGPAGKVVAFEPLPRNLTFLRQHVEVNSLKAVEIRTEALCDREGVARFGGSDDATQTHLGSEGDTEVRTTSLDLLIQSGLPVPDVMKIDVEGAEYLVFEGAQELFRHHRPVVFLATHSDDLRNRCGDWLRERNYVLTPLNEDVSEFAAFPG